MSVWEGGWERACICACVCVCVCVCVHLSACVHTEICECMHIYCMCMYALRILSLHNSLL